MCVIMGIVQDQEGAVHHDSLAQNERKFHLWYHELYTEGIDKKARFPRDRYLKLLNRLHSHPQSELFQICTPELIDTKMLKIAHSEDYVNRFLAGELTEKEEKRIGLRPWTPKMIERTLRLMSGALEATEFVVENGGIAGNMAGGTHHAHRDFGSGYCVFNDLAVSALHAVENLGLSKVAIIDLDVHQGDGTASILKDSENVLTVSVHCSTNFPFRKSMSDVDIPLDPDSTDLEFLKSVHKAIQVCKNFNPELILFQAGVDGLETDGLGKLSVSRRGMQKRNIMVLNSFVEKNIPIVVFMGGGYSKPINHTIDAFEDLFLQAAMINKSIS